METDACGICNGNNNLATLVSNSSSEVVDFGMYVCTIMLTFSVNSHVCIT